MKIFEITNPNKISVKPIVGSTNTFDVVKNGEIIATLYFYRPNSNDMKKGSRCKGWLKLSDGTKIDLSGYSYFKDIVRDLPMLIEKN